MQVRRKGRARDVQGMCKGLFTWFGLQLAELVVLLSASSFCAVVLQQSEDFCSPPITVCVCVCLCVIPVTKGYVTDSCKTRGIVPVSNMFLLNAQRVREV